MDTLYTKIVKIRLTTASPINDSTNRNLSQVLFKIIEIVVLTAINFDKFEIFNSNKNNINNKKYIYKLGEVCS